jgi:hypothetical protein
MIRPTFRMAIAALVAIGLLGPVLPLAAHS